MQQIENVTEKNTTDQNAELWSPVPSDTSVIQLLDLKFKELYRRGDRKIVIERKRKSAVRLCVSSKNVRVAMSTKSHQQDHLNKTRTRTTC